MILFVENFLNLFLLIRENINKLKLNIKIYKYILLFIFLFCRLIGVVKNYRFRNIKLNV